VAALAQRIWRQYYPQILSQAQIDYMLEKMYSLEQLETEWRDGITFDLLIIEAAPAGFLSYGQTSPGVMKLHKLYLESRCHGKGLGTAMLQHFQNAASIRGFETLVLAVNKRNEQAIRAYQRFGFDIAESVSVEIGGGFVMDDFQMRKKLE
jgi:ribosomal protein S18 acetylase RimI-like enzyme